MILQEEVEYDVLLWGLSSHSEVESAAQMKTALLSSNAALQELLEEHHSLLVNPQDSVHIHVEIRRARRVLGEQLNRFERHLNEAQSASTRGREHAESAFDEEEAQEEEEELQWLQQIQAAFSEYNARTDTLVVLVSSDLSEADLYLDFQIEPLLRWQLVPLIEYYWRDSGQEFEEGREEVHETLVWTRNYVLFIILLGVVLAIGGGWLFARYLVRPLTTLTEATRAFGQGTLHEPINIHSKDEIGHLAATFNQMMDDLSRTMVSKNYVDNIIQSMADTLAVVDMDGQVRTVNKALTGLLHYTEDEIIGLPLAQIICEPEAKVEDLLAQVKDKGHITNVEVRYCTKQAERIDIALSGALMTGSKGQEQGMVYVAHDITSRKQYEAQLIEARNKAEELVQMKNTFVNTMSHELRTPLTGILGAAQILKNDLEEKNEFVEVIELSGLRLFNTLNAVLDLAQIEAGKMEPDLAPVAVLAQVKKAVQALTPLASQKGLTLKVKPPQTEVQAVVDQGLLERVLDNLIGNAIKFTNEGGVTVEVESDEAEVFIRIRDTGIGISETYLTQVFDTFTQESSGLARNHEGNGLGLAIAQRLVELMEGRIEVQSRKGEGSIFTLCFPVHQSGPRRAAKNDGSAASAGGSASLNDVTMENALRILIVEDDVINRKVAQHILREHTLFVAATPTEAYDVGETEAFDLMLIDINLGMDETGEDVLHTLRQMPRHARTPAIAMTAYAMEDDRKRFLDTGFDGYLSKPYTCIQLQEVIAQFVNLGML
ncbi:MAG TPA: ATP-binding protein [Rhodothermales bacterium]|nr:ATP-binding protein [Rhodothermales bacterium]